MKTGRLDRVLKWYPSRWRSRYGGELVALMEDTYGEGGIPLSSQFAIMRTGAAEHLHEIGRGLVIVFVAAAIALPAVPQFLRDGGWAKVRRPVVRALIISTTTALLTMGMVWAHRLGPAQHNGRWGTHLIGSLWVLLVVASIGTCTLAAAAVARHLQFSEAVLRLEGLLAVLLTLLMVTIISGALAWSVAIANDAPRLLSGSGSGFFGVPGLPAEIITGLLMLSGLILGVGGAGRVARSIRAR